MDLSDQCLSDDCFISLVGNFTKFRKIGKKKEGESEETADGAEITKQGSGELEPLKSKGPKEASVIYTGSKQVNVIVKGGSQPMAVPKMPKTESNTSGLKPEHDESQNYGTNASDPTTSPDKGACVEINLNDSEDMVPDPKKPKWHQQFVKKLKAPHFPAREPRQAKIPKDNTLPFKKGGRGPKFPKIFDLNPPNDTPKLEYKFDEWNCGNLNPDYHEPCRTLSPLSTAVKSYGHQYWGEFFAFIQPVADFVIALFLELLSFVARVSGQLLAGTLIRLTDLLIKPILVFTFNALILPPFILLQNILRALANATVPLFEVLHRTMEVVAVPIQAFRLVEIKNVTHNTYTNTSTPNHYQMEAAPNNGFQGSSNFQNMPSQPSQDSGVTVEEV